MMAVVLLDLRRKWLDPLTVAFHYLEGHFWWEFEERAF
jgi:hypothetical protein